MKAVADLDVGDYAVFHSGASSTGGPFSGRRKAYWFPDVEVKANDTVVLYTKKGKRSTKPLGDGGGTAYFFYWGSEEPLWTSDNVGAVLLEVAEWDFEMPAIAVSE